MKLELRSVRIKNCGPIDDIRRGKHTHSHTVLVANLNSAHQVVDSKRILHWIEQHHFRTGRDYLFRLLTKEVRPHNLPNDIVKIVHDRILGSART
jgi:hypothetical protein